MSKEMLVVNNLSKRIKGRNLVDDVSFKINEGEICGFLGPNGAGKTTMIRLITNLINPTKGEIILNNFNVVKDREKALEDLGAIVESPIFFNYLTGRGNLENLALLNKNMDKRERKEKVNEVLKIVGLDDRANDKVGEYSLGMKQRLGIAQALLNDPKLIILDEPSNGLDPMGMRELRELVLKLQQERNITFLISSHLLDELQHMCNKFIIINKGKKIWQGSKDDLLKMSLGTNRLEDAFIEILSKN